MNKLLMDNPFQDDLTLRNYLALYACIINPKLSYNSSLRIFGVRNRKTNEEIEDDLYD